MFEENDFKGLKGISFDISVYDVSPRLTLINENLVRGEH